MISKDGAEWKMKKLSLKEKVGGSSGQVKLKGHEKKKKGQSPRRDKKFVKRGSISRFNLLGVE